MKIYLKHKKETYKVDLNKPIDISLPMGQVRCFYAPEVVYNPYESEGFVGSVKKGAPVNYFNLSLNPHGNGTHTECLGHITLAQESVNDILHTYHFIAHLISFETELLDNGDKVISLEEVQLKMESVDTEVLIIRTLPNTKEKTTADYSDTNPVYLPIETMEYLVEKGIKHLLIDTPSVDREKDEGLLLSHHAFWLSKEGSRKDCTITELIFVPDHVQDGLYLLNIQTIPIQLDASPSRPVLYALKINNDN